MDVFRCTAIALPWERIVKLSRRFGQFVIYDESVDRWIPYVVDNCGREHLFGLYPDELMAAMVAQVERHRLLPWLPPDPVLALALGDTWNRRLFYDVPSGHPYDWSPADRSDSEWDALDFDLDLGCGKLKKGRIGIDRYPAPGVDIVMDLDRADVRLPIPDSSIASIISHHALEHVTNLIPLVDECYRVLEPGGILRAITPLFPSWNAVSDPDHKRMFLADLEGGPGTWDSFSGTPGDTPQNCWMGSFAVPYTRARFERVDQVAQPRVGSSEWWTPRDVRELRVALKAMK